jgi:hypothetical protein
LLNHLKKLIRNYGKTPDIAPQAQKVMRDLLETEAWQLIEDDIKNTLTLEYAGFMSVSPDRLQEKQLRVDIMKKFVQRIYQLAGCEWEWNGYSQLKTAIDPKDREAQMQMQEIIEILEGGIDA